MRLSVGDIFLLVTPFVLGLRAKLNLRVYAFVAILGVAIAFHSYLFARYVPVNTVVTLPLKFLMSFQIYALLKSNVVLSGFLFPKLLFFCLAGSLLFFAESNQFTDIEVLNDNEGVHYLLTLGIFITFLHVYSGTRSYFPFIALFCMLVISITSFSRQGIILTLIIFFLMYWKSASAISRSIVLASVSSIIAVVFTVLSSITDASYEIRRLQSVFFLEAQTGADMDRIDNIIFGIDGFLRSPLFGNGVQSFFRNNELNLVAHNTFITVIYEFGLVGALPLAMAVFLLVKPYFRIASTSDLSLVFVCSAFIAFCFQLLTIEALSRSTIFIIFPFAIHILVCVSQDRRAYVSGHEAVSR